MKKLNLAFNVAILCIASYTAFSQSNENDYSTSKNEFNIVVDDIFTKSPTPAYPLYYSALSYIPYYDVLDESTPKIGLGYKRHFNFISVRSKASFGTKNFETENKDNNYKNEGEYLTLGLNLGVELHNNFNRVQMFYGTDVFGNYSKTKTEYTSGFPTSYTNKNTILKYGYGVSPFIGTKFFITPNLSLSTELKFIAELYKTVNTVESDYNQNEDKIETSGINTKLGPLGQLSVNIHF